VGGGTLYYEDDGRGAPVLMLHGFALDHRMWEPQVRAMRYRFRLVRPDLRGFGRSTPPHPDHPYSHVDDLASLLDALDLPAVHIVGLSMGAGVAVEFTLAHPERVRSLVMIDAAVDGFDFKLDQGDLPGIARTQGVEAARALWLASDLFVPALRRPEVAAALRTIVGDYSGVHWLTEGSTEVRPPEPPMLRLGELDLPSLVLVGELDVPDFHRLASRLASEIRYAGRLVVPGAGHIANMEEPVTVNRLLEEFLAGVS